MTTCDYCSLVESGRTKLYEDDKAVAFLNINPASFGHITLVPRTHFPIFEQVPDELLAHLSVLANKLSIVAFEALKVAGTNVVVENGIPAGQVIPHVAIHIIPRAEGDGLGFVWQPKQLTEEEMSTVELMLKEDLSNSSNLPATREQPVVDEKPEAMDGTKKDNYMIRQLNRIP